MALSGVRPAIVVLAAVAVLAGCTSSPSAAPPPAASSTPTTAPPTTTTTGVPRPDHVLVVVEENRGYTDVTGDPSAGYLHSVAGQGAVFSQSFAIAHPSEPNYLALFSGSTQGVTDDSCPHSFGTPNLSGQLFAAGLSFAGYSEGQPQAGYVGCAAGEYARKHNPWVNFAGVPATANLPFAAFPTDYGRLPTVSFVIPDLAHDMHDGTVGQADGWLRANLDGYLRWARDHRSLLVVTWDEDDGSAGNQILTLIAGAGVKPGRYAERINHYTVLRTIEASYGLAPLGAAASVSPITDVWG